jgi:hypothetical protein
MDGKRFVHIFMDKNDEFAARIKRLLDGREKYPWGHAIGLGKGTIDGMTRTGSIPGGETLALISRYENMRIDWLLEGKGTPYYVTACATDEMASEVFHETFMPETWEVTLVIDGDRIAAVLTQPGKYQVKDGKDKDEGHQLYRWIDYTIVEVITGALGHKALSMVRDRWVEQHGVSMVYIVSKDAHTMDLIEEGELGTYRLCYAPDAVLSSRESIVENHPIFTQFMHAADPVVDPDEAELIELFRSMSREGQKAFMKVAAEMSQKKKS